MYDATEVQGAMSGDVASAASVEARLAFIRRTYAHLAGAIAAFVLTEVVLFQSGIAEKIALFAFRSNWLLFLGGFMLVGFIANRFAMKEASSGLQYLGLGLYALAEAFLFVPILFLAVHHSSPHVLPGAAITTLLAFTGLTSYVLLTRKDFSFLGGGLAVASMLALGLIVCGVLFGLSLGIWFSLGMAALAALYVVYDTSNVLHRYRTDQHVAASLALFASIALMFWYVLRIFMRRD